MKKLLTFITFLAFINTNYSQTDKEPSHSSIDSMLVNVDTSTLTSPFLYDRTTPLAALTTFNTPERNVATKDYFEQALFELYNASNKTRFTSYKSARNIYAIPKTTNNVEIGFINAEFQSLNYNEDRNKSAVSIENNKISKINNLPLFNTNTITIAAPLINYAVGKTIKFSFNKELFFQASNNSVKTIEADFGNNTKTIIYNNGSYVLSDLNVNYTVTGPKTLTFKVSYADDTVTTTYGTLHVKVPEGSNKNMPDSLVDDFTLTSTIPFQGYEETTPILGELEYRVFYHDGNTQKKILKPIIIIDGFDPLDRRKIQDSDPHPDTSDTDHNSIEEIMIYYDNITGDKQFIVPILRNSGYDVIIVNHPKYTRTINGVAKIIDGGADYIERNGLNHVTLYNHLNNTLLANGSNEALVIVGPSMGGQISRYALSYMEKNNMPHNVRLWVSVDSPHLGANIPVGAQALINVLKDYTDSSGANDFVEDWLGSAAAKQQLIEQYNGSTVETESSFGIFRGEDLKTDYFDAKTVSQGFSETRGHPFFTQFYDNMYNNGLPNSKGYPQNTRSIAIVNGSLSGTRAYKNPFLNLSIAPNLNGSPILDNYATYGAKTLKVKGSEDYLDTHLVTMETYSMANPNLNHKLAYFKKKKLGGWDYYHRYGVNVNQRGSLDNLQGGWYPTQREVAKAIIQESPHESILGDFTNWSIGVDNWEIDDLEHVSSFIPTVSALGFTNPEFNWGEYIDTNLLCSQDIPFDSFYAPKINEQHTSFTEESVNWLLQELAGNPQPINGSQSSSSEFLSGPNTLNECQTRQYTAPFVHKVNDYVWTLSGDNSGYCDWEIVSGQGSRIVTIRSGVGFGILTCRPRNSCGNGTMFYKNLHGNEVTESNCGPQLRISPNPNKGDPISIVLKLPPNDPCNQFRSNTETLDFSNYIGENLWIYNFYGNLIYESLETSKETYIRSLNLTAGIYVIKRLDAYGKMHIGKLIIE